MIDMKPLLCTQALPQQSEEDAAAKFIRGECGVFTRAEILLGTEAAEKWRKLHNYFVAWKLAG